LPIELAELCGGLLASVVDDLVTIGRLPRLDFERTKRKQRVLRLLTSPQRRRYGWLSLRRRSMGARLWRTGTLFVRASSWAKLAWLLGMDTETSWGYGRRQEKRNNL